jgi:glycosyltransferase involved in cell wall biosynthesis
VLPSQNENFGNTAMEAATIGTPVVVTENCGVAPLLAGTAGIVVAHETEGVARAVEQVLSDSKLREQLSEAGKKTAGKLGWEEPVGEMEKLYAALAATHRDDRQSASRD